MPKDRSGYIGQDKTGKWFARVTLTDSNGKRRNVARRAKDRSEAKQILKRILQQIEDEGEKTVDAARLTFNDLADFYSAKYLKPAEYRHERKISGLRALDRAQQAVVIFRQHFGTRKLRSLTYSDLYNLRAIRLSTETQYKRQRSIATVNRELVVLRRILNIGVREGYLLKSPFNSGDPLICAADENKRERILSRDEEARLFAAIDAEPKREHLAGILKIALDCALRRGEILTLRWSDLNLERRTITVRAFNCKTARSRTVAMTTRVHLEMQRIWAGAGQDSNQLIFKGIKSVRTSFAKACKAANVQDFHLHDCRHTAITRMIRAGLPPIEVIRISGHANLSGGAFYRYCNLDSDSVFRAAAALDAYHAQSVEAQATTTELIQ
jgi:integrase